MKISKEELFDLYWNKEMSIRDIAKKFNVDYNAVYLRIKRGNILKRNFSEAKKVRWKYKDYREKTMEKMLKGLFKRPTRLEQKYIFFFKEYKIPLNIYWRWFNLDWL